jgi:hypothetical protein
MSNAPDQRIWNEGCGDDSGRMRVIAVDVETSKSLDGTPSRFCRRTSRPQARQVVRL